MSRGYIAAEVQWHHAVNTRQKLTTVLVECQSHPETPSMLEADVTRGSVIGSTTTAPPTAIMAHPPDTKGDLSFVDFIDAICAHVKGRPGYHQQERPHNPRVSTDNGLSDDGREGKRRSREIPKQVDEQQPHNAGEQQDKTEQNGSSGSSGEQNERATHGLAAIKLDFKNPVILHPCLKYIKQKITSNELTGIEIWLNADILQGPGGKPSEFNPDEFIDICRDFVPTAKLSLGFTHGSFWEGKYSKEMIDQLLALCKRHSLQNVTFALNSVVARKSPEAKRLVVPSEGSGDDVLRYSLTMWGEADKQVMNWISTSLDPMRTFIDTKNPSSMLFSMKKGIQGVLSKRPWSMTMLDQDDGADMEAEEEGEGEQAEGNEEQPLESGEDTKIAELEDNSFEPEGGNKIQ